MTVSALHPEHANPAKALDTLITQSLDGAELSKRSANTAKATARSFQKQ
jgi:hypothetical protein